MELIFASNNLHKLEEVRKILPAEIHVLSLNDIGFHHEIEETGTTLSENSRIKAEAVRQWLEEHPEIEWDGIFADDTGLEIAALNGAPGVYTARWAGEDCIAANNRRKALTELQGKSDRSARFRTVVTLIRGEKEEQVDGIVNGKIATEERGEGGFGYDPIFIPEGEEKTFAELPAEMKNQISHRARAMAALRRILVVVVWLLSLLPLQAGTWRTHFSYATVSQIANTQDKVFALSSGALFSVNKQTEEIEVYNGGNGLHSTGIHYIFSDATTHKMVAIYGDGKMDILHPNGTFIYSSDLYNKSMIESKRVNNVTTENGIAYMAMPFGILTYNLKKEECSAVYYIGDSASNVNVLDIRLTQDSIYAIGDSVSYVASRQDNLYDYTQWHSEPRSNRIVIDTEKGIRCVDTDGTTWEVAGANGLACTRVAGSTIHYLPNGPRNNIPYYMHCTPTRLYVLNGGRWAVQNRQDANIMMLENGIWTTIPGWQMRRDVSANYMLDLMAIAEDPQDASHFFTASYGCGVVEVRNNICVAHYMPNNSSLEASAPTIPERYTRVSDLVYDQQGNLLMLVAGNVNNRIAALKPDGTWTGNTYRIDGEVVQSETPGRLLVDRRDPTVKYWIGCRSSGKGLVCTRDGGTPFDVEDDETVLHESWVDQDGNSIEPAYLYNMRQMRNGDIWIGSDMGIIIIPSNVDVFQSNQCRRLRLLEDGEYMMESQTINDFTQDIHDNVWVASNTMGVYVLTDDAETLVAHYLPNNTLMPSACILSLAAHPTEDLVYIGTSDGVISYSGEEEPTDSKHLFNETVEDGEMGQWKLYPSYQSTRDVVYDLGAGMVYGLANGNLFSVNVKTDEITTYDKSNGLSGSVVSQLQYDNKNRQMVIIYTNGMIDFIYRNTIYPMSDFYLKADAMEVSPNQSFVKDGFLYMAMPFGIAEVNMAKREVKGIYYIGENASAVNVLSVTATDDSIYAMSSDTLYRIAKTDNAVDYHQWQRQPMPETRVGKRLMGYNNKVYLFADSALFRLKNDVWDSIACPKLRWANCKNENLLVYSNEAGLMRLDETEDTMKVVTKLYCTEAFCNHGWYWLAGGPLGLRRLYSDGGARDYSINSPLDNNGYRLSFFGNTLYAAAGGRWAVQYNRPGNIKLFNNGTWQAISAQDMRQQAGMTTALVDIMGFAVDPRDETHFYAAAYGNGLLEIRDNKVVKLYTPENSTLSSAAINIPERYTRVDAPTYDVNGNLIVLNTGSNGYPVNILSPDGTWTGIQLKSSTGNITFETTCSDLIVDNRNTNWKWMAESRNGVGVILWDDHGTPLYNPDDKVLKRGGFVDQKGKVVDIQYIYCMAQDRNGVIWVGTNAGPILIEHEDFFTTNACTRVIIRRNDGTDLADYLLADEQINAIAIDGGNRKWIGTAKSGLYLMSEDGQETIHHFTAENSNLPSSEILSIAINKQTGDVFVGTAEGIASYRSDATEPMDDMSSAYAYPNPVRPGYTGLISITGLMDNSWVTITDAGGNLVCKTRSYGGTATWDGRDQHGKRVASGVYSALCNAGDGKGHTVVKILIMN